MTENRKLAFSNGMRDGIPIALGYFAVAFTVAAFPERGVKLREHILLGAPVCSAVG